MRRETRSALATASTLAIVAPLLGACNTSEALTPQMPVGNGNMQSSPVTAQDLDRAAAMTPGGAQQQARAAPGRSPPQNTMEAQAQALESGARISPSQTAPDGNNWPSTGSEPAQPAGQLQPPPPAQQTAPPAATASTGTIRFLPIIGAPVQAVTPLSRQLGVAARAGGLTIRASADESAEHILKGYLSSFADSGKVTVIYVWDVLDQNGARIHRIQGQETVPGGGADPWSAVPATTMQTIADKTLANYLSWKQHGGG